MLPNGILTLSAYGTATSVAAAATNTTAIDTKGYKFLKLALSFSTGAATTKFTTLKLSHSNITDATGYTDLTAFVGGGTGGFTIPTVQTTQENKYVFDVDLRGKARYIKLTFSPITAHAHAIAAYLDNAEQSKDTATLQSVDLLVEG